MIYDYLIVGAGLFGSIIAHELNKKGKSVLVVEKKSHIGGTIYTENFNGIHIHKYGAHIFRTSEKWIWDYMNNFGKFNHYIHSPIAVYKDEIYNLPFNMNTFSRMWNIQTPDEAKAKIESQIIPNDNPTNLEEFVLSKVGTDVYEKLIKGYTEKQWGVDCKELPVSTMNRVPFRLTYDNNYYTGKPYQGVPIDGYTNIISNMLNGIEIVQYDGREFILNNTHTANKVIYTGCIDEFFDYKFGQLGYRTLKFEESMLDVENYQGNTVVNYTERNVPYTRIIEHKHFTNVHTDFTVITKEYPSEFVKGSEPYYPLLDEYNTTLYSKYLMYAKETNPNIIFCGKLGSYKYTDMEDTVRNAFALLSIL